MLSELMKFFTKAKNARDLAKQYEDMPEDVSYGVPGLAGGGQVPPMESPSDVLGSGAASLAAEEAMKRNKRLREIERALFY